MSKKRDRLLAAFALVVIAAWTASPAASAPSENASCVAQGMSVFGPPGAFQSQAHAGRALGERVSEVARFPRDCPGLP